MTREELARYEARADEALSAMRTVLNEDGRWTSERQERYAQHQAAFDEADAAIRSGTRANGNGAGALALAAGGDDARCNGGPFLDVEQRMADWVQERGIAQRDDLEEQRAFSLGAAVRGVVKGKWDGAERERRALSSGVDASGGVLVPELVSAQVIDALRDRATAVQAGARLVPMGSESVTLPKVASLPQPAWRAQNSPVAESEPGFEGLTLKAKTLAVICRVPFELFEDVSAEASQAIEDALVASLALELDRAAYFGDGTADSPIGLVNTAGVAKTAVADNGAVPTDYSALVAAYYACRRRNAAPTAAVFSERTAETFAGLTDSTGQPLRVPPAIEGLPQLSTNAVPDDEDQGTTLDQASSLIAGQFDQLAIGARPEFGFRVVSDRSAYIDTMQVAVLAYIRADVGVISPAAFDVRTGILA